MKNVKKGFRLSKEDKKELLEMTRSKRLREDFGKISEKHYNLFLVNGEVDLDKFIDFLNDYNKSINHARPPFRKMIAKDMRL